MGEVFSRAEGFRTIGQLVPPVAFHVVFSLAGMWFLVQAKKRRVRPADVVAQG